MASVPSQKSRLVIFVGPHKSASSSIQEFFLRHAPSLPNVGGKRIRSNHHPSLVNWTWPFIIRRRSYQSRKGFAPLVTEYNDPGWEKAIHETISEVWKSSKEKQIILGTEEFDRFGKVPWSGRDGLQAVEKLIGLLQADSVDLVVNYRRPRNHQWISIWKQLTRKEKKKQDYSEYLCRADAYDMLWEYLDCVANPIGLANALLERFGEQATIHILDMEGISKRGLDITHTFACQILQNVHCTKSWVVGMPHPAILNRKFGNPGISQKQLDEMEWMFVQRDCAYFEDHLVLQHPSLKVHYGESISQQCASPLNKSIPRSAFANTTVLLKLLKGQIGCGGSSVAAILRNMEQKTLSSSMQSATNKGSTLSMTMMAGRTTLKTQQVNSNQDHEWAKDAIRMQRNILLIGVAIVVGLFLRRIRFNRNSSMP